MNDEKNGQPSPGGDFLDKWIEQNLHMEKPAHTPQNQPKTTHPEKPSMPKKEFPHKPVQPGSLQNPSKPTQIAHKPMPHKSPSEAFPKGPVPNRTKPQFPRKPHFADAKKQTSYQPQSKPLNTMNQNQPVKTTTPINPKQPEKKNFFGMFKRPPATQPKPVAPHTSAPKTHHAAPFVSAAPTSMQAKQTPQTFRGKLRIIPLGGLDEVGKNCMALEYGDDIIIIDMGFQFPEEDMLGVDYVIPDMTYLDDKIDKIRGILITHGHLDHIGAIPYIVPKLNFPPIYGTKLTMGLVDKRLEEFGLLDKSPSKVVSADDVLQLGQFNISFFRVNHSIPDAVGIVVKTPAGNIVHTGDFKFDFTPSGEQKPADFARIAGLAKENIAALFIDSTNALKPGYTISEKKVGDSLETIIKNIESRIVIASFSSQIGRLQQIIDLAQKYGRTIFLSGRSLIDNIYIAQKLGYLKVPAGLIHDIKKVKKIPEMKALILTTGSQGEPTSALTRMALEEHPSLKIGKGDAVVLSSSPIPGNERSITTVTNNLSRLGAKIINNQIMDIHTSGHAQQEDLKLMMSLVKPKYVVPVHGEYFMRFGCKELALSLGYADKNAIVVENGDILEIENNEVRATGEKAENKYILIDGLGVGDIGAQVMMDRQTLAENGVLIVVVPVDEKTAKLKGNVDIISRGFIYMKESEELVNEMKLIAQNAYTHIVNKRADLKRADAKKYIKETVDKFVHQKLERHPLILPIIIEK